MDSLQSAPRLRCPLFPSLAQLPVPFSTFCWSATGLVSFYLTSRQSRWAIWCHVPFVTMSKLRSCFTLHLCFVRIQASPFTVITPPFILTYRQSRRQQMKKADKESGMMHLAQFLQRAQNETLSTLPGAVVTKVGLCQYRELSLQKRKLEWTDELAEYRTRTNSSQRISMSESTIKTMALESTILRVPFPIELVFTQREFCESILKRFLWEFTYSSLSK